MIRLGLAPPRLALLSLDLHCAMQLLPIAIQPLGSSPARSLPKQAFNGLRQQTVCTEIPIASNAPPCHTSRGFLPWRFAYAGPRVRRTTFTGPASANLHMNGSRRLPGLKLFLVRPCPPATQEALCGLRSPRSARFSDNAQRETGQIGRA